MCNPVLNINSFTILFIFYKKSEIENLARAMLALVAPFQDVDKAKKEKKSAIKLLPKPGSPSDDYYCY